MSCKYEKYIDSFLDGDLSQNDAAEFKEHLKSCRSCSDKISEINNFDIDFVSVLSDIPFESNEKSILSKTINKKFRLYSMRRYFYAAAALLVICSAIYYFKPICNYVSENLIDKVSAPSNIKIQIPDSELNDMVSGYLLKYKNFSIDFSDYANKTFEVHKIYGTEQKGSRLYVYIYSFIQSYCMKDFGKPVILLGSSYVPCPALIIIENKDNALTVYNYIEPSEDQSADSFIKETFPKKYADEAMNDSKSVDDMKNTMNDKINRWSQFTDMNLTKIKINLPKDMTFKMSTDTVAKNVSGSIYKNNDVIGEINVSYYEEYYKKSPMHDIPNHSGVLSQETIKTPLGTGNLFILERDNPAASHNPAVWNEMHAYIHTDDNQYEFGIWLKTKDAGSESKKEFLDILNNITF